MKTNLITLVITLILSTSMSYTQTTFGVRAGVNLQNLNGKDEEGDKLKNDLKVGFHAGVDVAIPIAQDFYIQPGLFFSTKGSANISEIDDLDASLSYIELPIHLAFKPQLGGGRLILGFGPYVGYAVSGKVTLDDEEEDIEFTNDVSIDDDGFFFLKPLDAGADIFFGYEFAFNLSFQINAQLGLLNLEPKVEGESTDAIIKNTGFGLSLGYRF